ncbi:MAG: nitroreductase family protein [Anaerolineae bacterium]
MDALETLFTRRSIRQYTDEPVAEEDLKTILEAGMNAPSANNRQPWHFLVVDDREKLDGIMEAHPYAQMLAQAPIAIVVVADTERSPSYFQQDCAAAIENMLLAARALELGTVWCGVYPNKARVASIAELFDIPEPYKPLAVVALGHPDEEKGRVDRWSDEKVHKNSW